MTSKLRDVMVDIETLDTTNNAVILSIGAVRFSEATGELGEEFYINVDPSSQRWRVVNPDTISWWDLQGQAAKDKLTEDPVVPLRQALVMLKKFLGTGTTLWSNGPLFDEAILRSAFDQLDGTFPVAFWNSRCCRTAFAQAKYLGVSKTKPEVAHDALSDAIAQARTIIDLRKFIDGLL